MSSFNTYPISCHDLAIPSILTYGFLVDGQLNAQKLLSSFEKLVAKWPILGARIRSDGQRSYQYIVPIEYSLEEPAFTHAIHHYPGPGRQHFVAPQPTSHPSIHLKCNSAIFHPPSHLLHTSIAEYASSNPSQPVFHFQIIIFRDQTAIGITLPHCFTDAGGLKEILGAWIATVRDADIRTVTDIEATTLRLEEIKPETEETIPFHLRFWEHLCDPPIPKGKGEGRWVFMPSLHLQELKRQCMDELQKDGDVWVSEGDVLYAWWIKSVYSKTTLSPNIPITITIPMDLRGRLPEVSSVSYLHNATFATYLNLDSIKELAKLSLAGLALRIRRTIADTSLEHVRQTLAYKTRQHHQSSATPTPTPFPPHAERITLSNWLKLDWGGDWMDFDPALTGDGSGKVLWTDVSWQAKVGLRSAGMACRRDKDGVWIWFSLADWRWKTAELRSMAAT